MSDFVDIDPTTLSIEELIQAAYGKHAELTPQLAVTLLHAKLAGAAERHLVALATDKAVDSRARHAATMKLAQFPTARQTLTELAKSDDRLVAQGANQALELGGS